ncbi:MAG: hypothetical protein M1812_002808 [Candelaria pacifica]|nr:MAG: hypothetical protein M1812_002808 [Candelaria pacifica]
MASRLHVSDANSDAVRKRIEAHKFENEEGEEYKASNFGGFTDYFRRKKIKLQNLDAELRSSAAENPQIFRGVVAQVNGYTQPSLNDLHKLIVTHGGGFMQYLDGKTTVTHIIASSLTPKKRIEFKRYRIVKPAWVVESVRAGKLLPWDSFRVLDEGVGQHVLGFDGGRVISQMSSQQNGYRDQTDTSWYNNQVRGLVDDPSPDVDHIPFPSTQIPPAEYDNGDSKELLQNYTGTNTPELHRFPSPARPGSVHRSRRSPSPTKNSLLEIDEGSSSESIDYSSNHTGRPAVETVLDVDKSGHGVLNEDPACYGKTEDGVSLSHEVGLPNQNLKRSRSSDRSSPAKKAKLTAEEHNAALLADPRVRKSTVVNPDFLKQYYQESRLHHLSTWKADLKLQLQQLTAEKSPSQQVRQKRAPGARRYILHVDFDSFFAAVSLKKAPEFKDKPAVVAHGGGSGSEIASCNYAARKVGVKNGMWMKRAQELCPDLKVLPYDFKAYEEASRNFYDAILDTGGIVQSVSVDEALVDMTKLCLLAGGSDGKGVREGNVWREQAKADQVAQSLRDLIKEKTECAVSVGIGGNILLAKVALRRAKPAGQHHIKPEEVLDFIGELTVQELPGVAHSLGGKLEELGVTFVKDIRSLTKERLMSTIGPKTGEKLWDYSRGIDRSEVWEQVVRKSVSAEVNWGVRFETQAQAEEFLQNLCGELHRRLVDQKVRGRQLTLKIMRRAPDAPLDPPKHLGHGKCDTYNKSLVLGVATNAQDVIAREAISVLRGFGFTPGELRGIGIQMTKLEALKATLDGEALSSQKRLEFGTRRPEKEFKESIDPIFDDVESPPKPRALRDLPIAPVGSGSPQLLQPNQKPLNTLGTQFVLPSQVDPEVMAELPEDIRSKFRPALEARSSHSSRAQTPAERSRPQSPALPQDILPSHSQLDQETLAALPDEVRAEVLAYYRKSPRKPQGQSLLPQSPRKNRSIAPSSKKLTTPNKKRAGLLFRGRGVGKGDFNNTLTQSNFVANASNQRKDKTNNDQTNTDSNAPSTEISSEFLDALPEDIRREVLAQQRRDRLKRRAGLDLTTTRKKTTRQAQPRAPQPQRRLRLPPKPPKPTFTDQKLSNLDELRNMISAWHSEFLDEGPYIEDVTALSKFLARIVSEERDLNKAVAVVKWMSWVITQDSENRRIASNSWEKALDSVKEGVQDAVRRRGLGRVEF